MASGTQLSRELGLFDITMLGVGAMIGAGIFVLTGIAAGAAGPALILSFCLNGFITIFTAMVYAELGSAIPEAGGGYLWVKDGLPGPNAFQAGWMSWFAHAVAGSLYAIGFASYTALLIEQFGVHLPFGALFEKGLAVAIVLVFLFINYLGASETGKAGVFVTLAKVVVLAVFVGSGLWIVIENPEYMAKFQPFAPEGIGGILSAAGLTFIAFEGYEIIVQAGEETQNPRRNIPRAVFLSLAVVLPIYVLVGFTALGAVESENATWQWLASHGELGIVEAASQFMPLGTWLLLAGGLLATMSALNATTFSSTRVSFAMGRDKTLPSLFRRVHDERHTPWGALAASGGLIIAMAVAVPIEDVASAADIMFLLLFLQVNVAAITIRKKYGHELEYGYLMPFFPVVPIIGIVTKLALAAFMFQYSPIAWYVAAGWIAVGFVAYYGYGRKHEAERDPPTKRHQHEAWRPEFDAPPILVAIDRQKSPECLVASASRAARRRGTGLLIVHTVQIPDSLPLSAARLPQPDWDEDLVAIADRYDVPVETLTQVCHDQPEAIARLADGSDAQAVIVDWPSSATPWSTRGERLNRLADLYEGELFVVEGATDEDPRAVLIPLSDPAELEVSLNAAFLLGAPYSKVSVLHVFSRDESTEDAEAFLRALQQRIDEYRAGADFQIPDIELIGEVADDPVDVVEEHSGDYDMVVVGSRRESWFRRLLFPLNVRQIARVVEGTVVHVQPADTTVASIVRRIREYVRPSPVREMSGAERIEASGGEAEPLIPDEHEWSTGQKMHYISIAVEGIIALGAIYLGEGGTITWLGTAAFILASFHFTALSFQHVARKEPASG